MNEEIKENIRAILEESGEEMLHYDIRQALKIYGDYQPDDISEVLEEMTEEGDLTANHHNCTASYSLVS